MDCVIANSRTVQQRLSRYLGIESDVVYPPCDTDSFRWIEQGDYYLSTARVDELKRVEVVAEAFAAMPDKKLVIVSDGHKMSRVRSITDGCSNIEVLGWVSQERLQDLMGRCIASIYIPRDEDFGISPVESMAAGKPVIGVDEGGVSETVLDRKTGLLLRPDPTPEDVRQGVMRLGRDRALSMKEACLRWAQCFTREAFVKGVMGLM
jgi:glycosyltransferase involved in cell wall biosynthesis